MALRRHSVHCPSHRCARADRGNLHAADQYMSLRVWRLVTIVVAALALTMESAHLLELPQKMRYDAWFYTAVNSTLSRYFAIVGGIYQVGSIVLAAILVVLVRRRSAYFRWALAGALCLLAAFAVWLAVVEPVNRQVEAAIKAAPESVWLLWMQLRDRWEYGHVAGFFAQLLGFIAITASVLVETPGEPKGHSC